ncbi:MAG TPA: TlpA disulfide reductase family protein [Rhodanobacter sp.]
MMSRSNWLIVGLAVLAAAIGGYAQHRSEQPRQADSALIGQPAPALALPDLGGKLHRLGDYRGHRLLLNFWASWCGPCLDKMPALNQAQAKFGEQEAIIVGIAMDDPGHVRAFLAAHPVSYPVLLGQLATPSTSLTWGDRGEVLPYSVLLDADGRILATHVGALPATQLAAWLTTAHGTP